MQQKDIQSIIGKANAHFTEWNATIEMKGKKYELHSDEEIRYRKDFLIILRADKTFFIYIPLVQAIIIDKNMNNVFHRMEKE